MSVYTRCQSSWSAGTIFPHLSKVNDTLIQGHSALWIQMHLFMVKVTLSNSPSTYPKVTLIKFLYPKVTTLF